MVSITSITDAPRLILHSDNNSLLNGLVNIFIKPLISCFQPSITDIFSHCSRSGLQFNDIHYFDDDDDDAPSCPSKFLVCANFHGE